MMMRKRLIGAAIAFQLTAGLASAEPSTAPASAFDKSVATTKAAMMADPQRALHSADQTVALAATLPDDREGRLARATALWLKGEALIGINTPDRAKPIVSEAIALVERDAPGSKLHGDLLRSRGAIAAIGGNVQAALRDFQAAYRAFVAAGVKRSQAIALQDIGEIYLDAGDYQRVLQYYAQSAETFREDPFLLLTTHNNRAQVLREMKRFPEAVAEYRAALEDAAKVGSPLLEVRILTNLAAAQIDAGQLNQSSRSIDRAFRLTVDGEAHGWQPFVFGVAAKLAEARGQQAKAAELLERMFAKEDLTATSMPYREFHGIAARVYESLGSKDKALAHLKAFQRLDREARNLTASTNAQLMAARFDFANQNLKIANLKQGQLARDIKLERQQARYRTILLGGLLGAGGIVLALLLFAYFSIRRSRNETRAANDNLTDTNAKLEKALQAKTEFLAMTSHEIRTPLNGILGMTQVLLADRKVDAAVRDKVEVVHGAGEAMKALVDDILDVAKMETGEVSIIEEETDLSRILSDSARLWSGQAQGKGIALTLRADDAPATIISDTARLRQVIFNLMSNAVKFTEEGSVELIARNMGDNWLEIVVRDTGIGISPDQHEVIFESFRQVDNGTSRRFGGTGLGLAICRKLVGAMGGSITVESELGRGATFTVRMPLALPDRSVDEKPRAEAKAAALATARLLCVEPNLLRQAMMRPMFAPVVSSIDLVADLAAAVDKARAGAIDHALLDIGPADPATVAEARDFLSAGRAHGMRSSVLHDPGADLSTLVLLGADQLIAKPVDGPTLIASLEDAYRDDGPRPASTRVAA